MEIDVVDDWDGPCGNRAAIRVRHCCFLARREHKKGEAAAAVHLGLQVGHVACASLCLG